LEGALQEGSEARDKAWRAHERDLETLRGELAEAKAEAAALAADKASLLRQVRVARLALIRRLMVMLMLCWWGRRRRRRRGARKRPRRGSGSWRGSVPRPRAGARAATARTRRRRTRRPPSPPRRYD